MSKIFMLLMIALIAFFIDLTQESNANLNINDFMIIV